MHIPSIKEICNKGVKYWNREITVTLELEGAPYRETLKFIFGNNNPDSNKLSLSYNDLISIEYEYNGESQIKLVYGDLDSEKARKALFYAFKDDILFNLDKNGTQVHFESPFGEDEDDDDDYDD